MAQACIAVVSRSASATSTQGAKLSVSDREGPPSFRKVNDRPHVPARLRPAPFSLPRLTCCSTVAPPTMERFPCHSRIGGHFKGWTREGGVDYDTAPVAYAYLMDSSTLSCHGSRPQPHAYPRGVVFDNQADIYVVCLISHEHDAFRL